MAHDRNGRPIRKGDVVTLRCEVVDVFSGDGIAAGCNLSLRALDPSGQHYTPLVSCNALLVAVEGAETPANVETPSVAAIDAETA